ncbi:CpaF family protein [Thiohalocapsa marina]|uniref:CpaF family protein n=1 Tax=Thiohalocapsa marina TaxID=424902 RepID=A0A5M8FNI6_9GAMM|nr:CpaF family protein [Thiohalocapsa marina]KAA6184701.1 CpaF family protein [Thiohalocapsa marina]
MALIRKPSALAPESQAPSERRSPDVWARTLGGGSGITSSLSQAELGWKREIFDRVVKALDLSLVGTLDDNEARRQIHETCVTLMEQDVAPFPQTTRQRIIRDIQDEILGLGPLEPLLKDPTVSDILVNGPNKVYIERRGKLEQAPVFFDSERHLMTIIDRIVSRVGRRIDEASPMVDARLADGSRVNAIIPPLAIDGPSLSIRRFPSDRLTMQRLIDLQALTRTMAQVLSAAVRARLNILISGGTGSGKTTLLNVLSAEIPPSERVITIEDSAELQLQQPHVVRLETRPPNIEGRGEVTQRDLVRNSLRMRPDRIVLGEIRGAEAMDMLQAMNTGHEGSLATIHANTPRDALSRVESMVAMTGLNLPARAVRSQIASALDILVQLERHEDGARRLVSIDEVQGVEGDMITTAQIFQFERSGIDTEGNVIGHHAATGLVPKFYERLRQRGIPLELSAFQPSDVHFR